MVRVAWPQVPLTANKMQPDAPRCQRIATLDRLSFAPSTPLLGGTDESGNGIGDDY
ncbi:hypothetical protein ZHAS_00008563 [Anopheles sinensis]|uniref:Uncharacterized protein n=1 Tax=Anopheles sinensis TaxID=74873 RepID=A0A084VT11_ANOSI|nr:hypothetical protein ZHAS_00008563 [Anopheles sinensis]